MSSEGGVYLKNRVDASEPAGLAREETEDVARAPTLVATSCLPPGVRRTGRSKARRSRMRDFTGKKMSYTGLVTINKASRLAL